MSTTTKHRSTLRSVARSFGLLWQVGPGRSLLVGVATLVDALLPAAIAWVAKRLVDAVVAESMHDGIFWLSVECGLVVLKSVLYHIDDFVRSWLGARLGIHVHERILRKTLDMRAEHFEDSAFTDKLARAVKEAGSRPLHLVTHSLDLLRESVKLLSYVVLLWIFSPWLVLAVLVGTTPQFIAQAWSAAKMFRVQMARTLEERRADYLKEVLTREAFIKEVKLFSLGKFLLNRQLGLQETFFGQDRKVLRRTIGALFGTRLLATLAFYACYAYVVVEAVQKNITLGDMTMLIMVVRGSQESFEAALNNAAKVYESHLYMSNLFEYLELPSDEPFEELRAELVQQTEPKHQAKDQAPSLRFEKVSFNYPGVKEPALKEIDFKIAPGETLALVGPNGAGKTTLIKLLTRLYDPSEGQILLDGLDISAMSPGTLRKRIGVIFQDFAQFHLSAKENIGVGWVPSMDKADEIQRAAEQGAADDFIEKLDEGFDTMLGRYYGGAQLSIGQWQRVALARAFMRHSDVLILDEPTAALDAQNEAALFERLSMLRSGRTAILITHRFSTVRFADRIVVLDQGRLVEQGTHLELMEAKGLYARMFSIQAKGYDLS